MQFVKSAVYHQEVTASGIIERELDTRDPKEREAEERLKRLPEFSSRLQDPCLYEGETPYQRNGDSDSGVKFYEYAPPPVTEDEIEFLEGVRAAESSRKQKQRHEEAAELAAFRKLQSARLGCGTATVDGVIHTAVDSNLSSEGRKLSDAGSINHPTCELTAIQYEDDDAVHDASGAAEDNDDNNQTAQFDNARTGRSMLLTKDDSAGRLVKQQIICPGIAGCALRFSVRRRRQPATSEAPSASDFPSPDHFGSTSSVPGVMGPETPLKAISGGAGLEAVKNNTAKRLPSSQQATKFESPVPSKLTPANSALGEILSGYSDDSDANDSDVAA